MVTRLQIRDGDGNAIPLDGLTVALPGDSFDVVAIPNFVGVADPNVVIAASLPQIGGARMLIQGDLPAPIAPHSSVDVMNARIATWHAAAAEVKVQSFTFEAMDFTLKVVFDAADAPTMGVLVRDWDFADDILSLSPKINGAPFSLPGLDLVGTDAGETLTGDTGDDKINGKGGADVLFGNEGKDRLDGGGASDEIYAGPGHDRVTGGPGNDYLYGDEGRDTLFGGPGNDWLDDREGNNVLYGGGGDDSLNSFNGDSRFFGGPGNDVLGAAFGSYLMSGGKGSDTLYGGRGPSTLKGGTGKDYLQAGSEIDGGGTGDKLYGGKGRDTLIGSWGDDTLTGGNGADFFIYFAGDGTEDGYQFADDTITDFDPAEGDTLTLTGFVDNLRAVTTLTRHSALIELDGYGTIDIDFAERLSAREFYAATEVTI